ncbi:CGI-like protein [Zea mays]|uniref:CGI-like protein n=2 Tax=Zea mays TaxID=4577 RepID=A0A1D6Q9H5_MAIZE|nr:CGI-like protein [Zea mays]
MDSRGSRSPSQQQDDGAMSLRHDDRALFLFYIKMLEYQNVVGGRLKLKGKALDVKDGGVIKKKKYQREKSSQTESDKNGDERNPHSDYDYLTPTERRYMEQKQKIDMKKMAKVVNKSYKDRMQDFNQYLANLSEHYNIPKVGPG